MRKIVCFIILFCMLFSVCSCQSKTEGLEEFENLLNNSDSGDATELSFASNLYIIVPQKASSALSAKASELGIRIKDKTKVNTIVKYDNEPINVVQGDMELLLGYTNRLDSVETLKNLKLGDYVCKWVKGKIVLGGRYEQATLAAVDAFEENILHGASASCLMNEDARLEHFEKYDVSKMTLNGYDLYDYTFVYPTQNQNNEKEIAQVLQAYIAQKSGYWLPIVDSNSLNDGMGKIIEVGKPTTSSEPFDDAGVKATENGVAVCGGTSYAISAAAASFAQRLFENISDQIASAEISEKTSISCSSVVLEICSAIVLENGNNSMEYLEHIVSTLPVELSCSDITIFNSVSDKVLTLIEQSLDKTVLNMKTLSLSNGSKTAVVFKNLAVDINIVEHTEQNLCFDVRLKNGEDCFRIFKELSVADTLTKDEMNSLLSANGVYKIAILEDRLGADGAEISFAGEDGCALGDDAYAVNWYFDDGVYAQKDSASNSYSGSDCAKMFSRFDVTAKYARAFVDLAKTCN